MIYLDSAAVVKLAHAEPESPALRSWLDERAETGWISSVLTEIESFRALARYAPDAVSRQAPTGSGQGGRPPGRLARRAVARPGCLAT
jgi:predicted nucleic acid-binding protein